MPKALFFLVFLSACSTGGNDSDHIRVGLNSGSDFLVAKDMAVEICGERGKNAKHRVSSETLIVQKNQYIFHCVDR